MRGEVLRLERELLKVDKRAGAPLERELAKLARNPEVFGRPGGYPFRVSWGPKLKPR
ncbi:MAG: hypothetical protein U0271_26780 [Polyangiaceae bacterium]